MWVEPGDGLGVGEKPARQLFTRRHDGEMRATGVQAADLEQSVRAGTRTEERGTETLSSVLRTESQDVGGVREALAGPVEEDANERAHSLRVGQSMMTLGREAAGGRQCLERRALRRSEQLAKPFEVASDHRVAMAELVECLGRSVRHHEDTRGRVTVRGDTRTDRSAADRIEWSSVEDCALYGSADSGAPPVVVPPVESG
ncbi:hypothetical protein [Mumia sp. ZJ1417]|uniref:hypothetical protein n=1 Tax=Mumia sp. ZJ1417 TaxID=2708082 RepID=UPI001AB056AF|nr:hypothetical protein [Mumia sp. ZJ1417]